MKCQSPAELMTRPTPGMKRDRDSSSWDSCIGMPLARDGTFSTPNAARLVRQHRLDGGPLMIAEFVAHNSRLRFGSLNHVLRGTVNPQRPVVDPLML